jgi:hypothetical protein
MYVHFIDSLKNITYLEVAISVKYETKYLLNIRSLLSFLETWTFCIPADVQAMFSIVASTTDHVRGHCLYRSVNSAS